MLLIELLTTLHGFRYKTISGTWTHACMNIPKDAFTCALDLTQTVI